MNNNKKEHFDSLVEMYEEVFDCSVEKMEEYLEKRILIEGYNLKEQDKIEYLYEEKTYFIDNFRVCEWDIAIEFCKYLEAKYEKK